MELILTKKKKHWNWVILQAMPMEIDGRWVIAGVWWYRHNDGRYPASPTTRGEDHPPSNSPHYTILLLHQCSLFSAQDCSAVSVNGVTAQLKPADAVHKRCPALLNPSLRQLGYLRYFFVRPVFVFLLDWLKGFTNKFYSRRVKRKGRRISLKSFLLLVWVARALLL